MEEWVNCPFFVAERGSKELYCENILNPRYAKLTTFENYKEKKAFMQEFCGAPFPEKVCPYAARLLEKYENGEFKKIGEKKK